MKLYAVFSKRRPLKMRGPKKEGAETTASLASPNICENELEHSRV